MFWADQLTKDIIKSGRYQPYWVDDMKTPSGKIHVGSLRGVVVHHLLYQSLKEQGKDVVYTYVFNDMDPMDGFPHYLPESFREHMGKPLFQIPSPEPGYESMAEFYAKEFISVFNKLGINPDIVWSNVEYKKGRFNKVIEEVLNNVDKVRKLYKEVSGYDKPNNWYPFQVICPQCGRVGTTIVTDWDGKEVTFECRPNLVEWAEGCGHQGKISPFNGTGKLQWKVDWAAHWKVIGITVEGAGKDHMSEGGSHDLSSAICEQVLEYPTPFSFIYEWFLAKGGAKMSSSKGVGASAAEVSETMPPELLKFLLVRTPYRRAIIFDPNESNTVLDLYDEYDRFATVYYKEGTTNDYGRIWELSQVGPFSKEPVFLPRFRDVVNYIQSPSVDIFAKFAEIKGAPLTKEDKQELEKRIKYAKIWLNTYAPEEQKVGVIAENVEVDLSSEQKKFLKLALELLNKDWPNPDDLQQALYETAKAEGIPPRKAFQAIYLALTGKTFGPKAAWFLLEADRNLVTNRFEKLSAN